MVAGKCAQLTQCCAGGGFAESFDPIQLKAKASGGQLSQSTEIGLLTGGSMRAPGAVEYLGYAVKPKRGKGGQRFTANQLAFLQWGYGLGVKDKNQKMTANVAAETMPTVGTMAGENKFTPSIGKLDPYMKANSDGKPTFRLKELLDVWRIKPWFSQQKQAFNKKLQAAAQAAAVHGGSWRRGR